MSLIKFIYTKKEKIMGSKTKKEALRKLGKPYLMLLLASSPLHSRLGIKRFTEPFYLAIG
ncbi:hypothetical protein B7699_06265 [Streptococcus mitis]|uniref:Uncharacterized protein n=1 Tax=Streptococcus mitis TaxID=28037 RepID=A0A1X1K0W5_STRMT|nr:hypothetical protein B7699_06265 [Streptococcus mitis]